MGTWMRIPAYTSAQRLGMLQGGCLAVCGSQGPQTAMSLFL